MAVLIAGCGTAAPSGSPSVEPSGGVSAAPVGSGAFAPGLALATGRSKHTATLLADGRVLVTGGYANEGLAADAEIRHATTGEFTASGRLGSGRYYHTATLLDDGRVLVIAGSGQDPEILVSAEMWDPVTATFSDAGALDGVRMLHTATRLNDGRVLIVGGYTHAGTIGDALLWDSRTNRFSPAGTLKYPRAWHTATLLNDGRVLIIGGPASAELWDPDTLTFSDAGTLATARWWPTATLLDDGRVAVIGGFEGEAFKFGAPGVGAIEMWDPFSRAFVAAGSLMQKRSLHTATLRDGSILIVGGIDADQGRLVPVASAEWWDPASSTTHAAASLKLARSGHTATLLPDGRVLVVGGEDTSDHVVGSTEIWTP
jgi:hypothetical protein